MAPMMTKSETTPLPNGWTLGPVRERPADTFGGAAFVCDARHGDVLVIFEARDTATLFFKAYDFAKTAR